MQLLLWSAKVAQDASDKTVLAKVLETLLGFCKKAPGTTDVDLMALLRFGVPVWVVKSRSG